MSRVIEHGFGDFVDTDGDAVELGDAQEIDTLTDMACSHRMIIQWISDDGPDFSSLMQRLFTTGVPVGDNSQRDTRIKDHLILLIDAKREEFNAWAVKPQPVSCITPMKRWNDVARMQAEEVAR